MNNVISWHSMGLASLYAYFFSGPEGLSQLEAEKRRAGLQQTEQEYRQLFMRTLWGWPAIYLAAIFLVAAFSFFNGYILAGGLGLVAALLYAFVFAREARQCVNWAIMLANLNREKILVYRDGQLKHHLPSDLVLGDVIQLQPTMIVPVTVRLIETDDLSVALDSTAEPQEKHATNFFKEETVVTKVLFPQEQQGHEANPINVVSAGSWVTKGAGKGIVIAIPEQTKPAWVMEQFHIEPLFTWKNLQTVPLLLAVLAALGIFMLVSVTLDDKSHGLMPTLLAMLGFLVLLFPVTAVLLQVHQANLQTHNLLRKHILLRTSHVFYNLANTSMIVADAEYLFQKPMTDISDVIAQGLRLIIITGKSKGWLATELAGHGILDATIIDHQQFSNQSDRQIEEQLKSAAYFADLTDHDYKRLFQVIKVAGARFVLIGERRDHEAMIPSESRLLLSEQTSSSLVRNATDILLLSPHIKDFLYTMLSFQKQHEKMNQNEAFLKTVHYFCATGVILAFLIGGGVGELITLSLLLLLGLMSLM